MMDFATILYAKQVGVVEYAMFRRG